VNSQPFSSSDFPLSEAICGWWHPRPARLRAFDRWLPLYNHHRAHAALGSHPAMTRDNDLAGQYI
jgi:hypothetical protein